MRLNSKTKEQLEVGDVLRLGDGVTVRIGYVLRCGRAMYITGRWYDGSPLYTSPVTFWYGAEILKGGEQ